MKLKFTKMQGLGNDFVVIEGIHQAIHLNTEQYRQLADRHFGVGCDQILLVESAADPRHDFRYRIFNADGGEVEQCGNGARCFARFVVDKGLTTKCDILVETARGVIELHLTQHEVTVNMGPPCFEPDQIPFAADAAAVSYPLDLGNHVVEVSVLSLGNPHAVVLVPDVDIAPVTTWGTKIESHLRFAQRVNAGFMQIVDRGHVKLRVFERGVGETLACGTGACAAAVAGIRLGLLDSPVAVSMRGGRLTIVWAGDNQPILMTGPAETVFEGEIIIN